MKMSPRKMSLIVNNRWLTDESLSFQIGLDTCQRPHEVFETVFLNLSAEIGKDWKYIYNANQRSEQNFIQLCVAAILIDKWLMRLFNFNEIDRVRLLGNRLADIVYKYKNSFGEND